MYYNKVDLCGVNTSKLKTLTEEEKNDLLKKVKAGDMAARGELIDGNLRLVLSIIQRFGGKSEDADDLFQVGCIGLIKAIDNFDIDVGVRFSTYAVPMIIGEIRRYLRDNSMIRISRGMRDLAYHALRAREELTRRLMREPTEEEIAKELGESTADVTLALTSITAPMSLYDTVSGDGQDTLLLMDQIKDEECGEEKWVDSIALSGAMAHLSSREKSIIDMRFFGGKTQMEIADEIGISQAQVSRIEKGALNRMKKEI